MKDQIRKVDPNWATTYVKETQKHMDGVMSIYTSISKTNGKLDEIVETSQFYDCYYKMQGALDSIISQIEDLHPNETLTKVDLQDLTYVEIYTPMEGAN